jgi:hypothetical protein
MIRDPRDVVISQAHYALANRRLNHHRYFASLPDLKSRILTMIRGHEPTLLPSIGELLGFYEGWLDAANHVLRFEDLVGPPGGGSADAQQVSIGGLFRTLGAELDTEHMEMILSAIFSKASPTFRRGVGGQWRVAFDREITACFKAVASGALVRYGYEHGSDW